ncbi:hypothetical protein [Klebsiella pneumoniae]|uniref:hypothetical protein n=1 Tax=Klebsiella pneumoniae TaxID=573 RepID=UPI001BAA2BFC|nr:hypothetical protein [Klebsiella pneumoniae]
MNKTKGCLIANFATVPLNMHVQVLQHVPFEGVGSMADWFQARGATLHYTRFYEADARLPDPASCDLIVAMGGPMSVNDESELPWLIEENGLQAELCTVSALQETAILIEDVIAGVAGQALDRTVTQ